MGEYEALVIQAKEKDVNAFAMLYELVYEDMYHMAFYMLGNAHDAEDVVSETVLAAFESIHKLRSAAAFKGWIFKILLNRCKRKRKSYVDKTVSEEAAANVQSKEAFFMSPEETMDVKAAFLQLPELDRTILAMSLFGGYTSAEIGKYLRLNANTVRTKRSRAIGKLQDMLIESRV